MDLNHLCKEIGDKSLDELGIEPRTFRMLVNMLSERSTN